MARVHVSYGPPGAKGVTSIMGVGADDVEPHPAPELLRKAAIVGGAIWLIGVVLNKPTLRGAGLGTVAVGLGVRHLTEQELKKPTLV